MWDELENALAWYAAAPSRWVQSAKKDLEAAAEWIWVVIQGDFAEDEQSTAQVVTGTVISMIPFVDQLCDVRDVVANCKRISEDKDNALHWFALAITLVGLIPVLGSLAKGCLKILFGYARKAVVKGAVKTLDSGVWVATRPFIEAGIIKLNQHLASPAVRKTLVALKINNVYKELAKATRTLKDKTSASALTSAFDSVIDVLKELGALIDRWGSDAMKTKTGQLITKVQNVRDAAQTKFAEIVTPLQNLLERIARRLDVESDMLYRADTNRFNPAKLNATRLKTDDELAALTAKKEPWADIRKTPVHRPMELIDVQSNAAIQKSISDGWVDPVVGKGRKNDPMTNAYKTFKDMQGIEIPPGTTLYRIVDPSSADNSICWMSKQEFDKLRSKDDWRRYFAVWKHWNSNGEYVTYVVPPGKPLKVWEGVTGSQKLEGSNVFLEGGARQIIIEPTDLDAAFIGKRQATGWGTNDGMSKEPDFTGLPTLTNSWRSYDAK